MLSGLGNSNLFIQKLNTNGNLIWAKSVGDSGNDVFCKSIVLDPSGDVYATGYFKGNNDFNPGAAIYTLTDVVGTAGDSYVLKLDNNGSFLWANAFGNSFSSVNLGITADVAGNTYTVGYFSGTSDADPSASTQYVSASYVLGSNPIIRKLGASGNYVWADILLSSHVAGTSIAIDNSGNTYVAGNFGGSIDFDPDPGVGVMNLTSNGNQDIYIQKFNASGTFIWAKTIGGIDFDEVNDIAVSTTGEIYITGRFRESADFDPSGAISTLISQGESDIFVAKFSAAGALLWAKGMGNTTPTINGERGYAIAVDGAGNAYTTGVFEGTVDFNPNAGIDNLVSVGGGKDIFVQKLDATGNFSWAKSIGGVSINDEGRDIAVSNSNNIHLIGTFGGTVDFDPSVGTFEITSRGPLEVFIEKLNGNNGSFIWAGSIGKNTITAKAITVDASESVFITGEYAGQNDFNPGSAVLDLSSVGGSDVYIEKIDAAGNLVWVKTVGGSSVDVVSSIALDASGNPTLVGYFAGTSDFDPDIPDLANDLSSSGMYDAYVLQLNGSTGAYAWAKRIGYVNEDLAYGIAINASNKAVITGIYGEAINIDPVASSILTSTGYNGAFTFQWSLGTVKQTQTISGTAIAVKYGDSYTSSAVASSGLPLTLLNSNPAVATVTGNVITISDVGAATITYQQPGNATYYAAPDLIVQLTASKKDLVVNAADYTRSVCDPNPTSFPNLYTGFVGAENESVLDQVPVYTTTATNVEGTYPITPTMGSYVDNHYSIITNDAVMTVTGFQKQAILGKDILSSDSRATYVIKPYYNSYQYAWYYSGSKMVILGDTVNAYLDVLPDDSTSNGTLTCVVTGCAGVDTLFKPVIINKKINFSDQLEKLTCAINRTNCTQNFISYVSIENIFESTNADCSTTGYSDYTASSTLGVLYMGDTYTARIKGGGNKGYFGLWIDYNNDGDFQDAQEYVMANADADYELLSPNVSIPNSPTVKGYRRMRVQTRENTPYQAGDPCVEEIFSGEIEDYIIKIDDRARLEAPQFISPNNDGSNDLFVIRGIDPLLTNNLFIMDVQGKIVYEKSLYQNTWPDESVKAGTYYFVFKNGDNELKSFIEVTR